jgi:pathogenesis-related protein 1
VVGITVEHNIARSAVDAPPLEWSPRLAAIAQAWSDRIAAQGCRLERSPDRSLGENLAGFSGTLASVGDVVASWIEERACYAGPDAKSAHTCRPGCGGCAHYTQVVWRGSTHLGCGVASCGADREVWTCNYEPAGNVVGAAPY